MESCSRCHNSRVRTIEGNVLCQLRDHIQSGYITAPHGCPVTSQQEDIVPVQAWYGQESVVFQKVDQPQYTLTMPPGEFEQKYLTAARALLDYRRTFTTSDGKVDPSIRVTRAYADGLRALYDKHHISSAEQRRVEEIASSIQHKKSRT